MIAMLLIILTVACASASAFAADLGRTQMAARWARMAMFSAALIPLAIGVDHLDARCPAPRAISHERTPA